MMFEEKIKNYKISTNDFRNASLVVVDGIVLKDRENSLRDYGGTITLKRDVKFLIGCKTDDGHIRYYRNY